MIRKPVFVFISVLIVMGLIIGILGCAGPSPTPTPSPSPSPSPTSTLTPTPKPTTTPTPSPSPTQPQVIKWRAQDAYPPFPADPAYTKRFPGGRIGVAEFAYDIADWITKRTNGRLQIEFAPPGSIVPVADMLSAVEKGLIDMTGLYYAGFHTGVIPEADVEIGLPYAWETPYEEYDALYNWGLAAEFQKIYAERNAWPLNFANGDIYHFATTFPIDTPDAVKGKKIRATGIYGEYVKALGGAPTVVAAAELYQAIKLGTLDGAIYGIGGLDQLKLKEVIKYYVVDPNPNTIGDTILFNLKSLNALPEDIRKIIQEELKYVVQNHQAMYYISERWVGQRAEKDGYIKQITWSAADKAKIYALSIGLWDTVAAKSARCKALVDIVKAQARDLGKIK